MAEVKWIKICTDIFDDEKIMLIEGMPDADSIIAIWFKLLCLAGKQNNGGVFMINEKMPYNEEMFATIFRRPINTVRLALNTFESFGMVEVKNSTYFIPNWEKHQNVEKMEEIREQTRKRVAKHRAKQKLLACNDTSNDDVTLRNDIEEEKEKEIEKEEEIHSIIHADATQRKAMLGKLGEGIVVMSQEQFDILLDKLSLEELHHYFEVIKDCERKGKSFKKKTHYQAILEMAAKDRKI